ncbi:MAG: LysR family transcriptional regulator [Oceanospirillaceae bacterium]
MDKLLTSNIQLNWLRTFEAVGKHLSFTVAARELNMSQSAVSQQIQLLEHRLGQRLFTRQKRSIFLTDAGKAFLPLINESFHQLNRGAAQIFSPRESAIIDISVNSAFSILWLSTHMRRFNALFPQISVRQQGTNWSSDFKASTAELEIRYGTGHWEGFHSQLLVTPELRVYCSIENAKKLRHAKDVLHFALLDVFGTPKGWQAWCEQQAIDIEQASSIHYIDSYAIAANMAANDMGICLLYDDLVEHGMIAKQLTSPFTTTLKTKSSYYLCYQSGKALSQSARYFADWLLEETSLNR